MNPTYEISSRIRPDRMISNPTHGWTQPMSIYGVKSFWQVGLVKFFIKERKKWAVLNLNEAQLKETTNATKTDSRENEWSLTGN